MWAIIKKVEYNTNNIVGTVFRVERIIDTLEDAKSGEMFFKVNIKK